MKMTESWARRVMVLFCLFGASLAQADPAPATLVTPASLEQSPVIPPEPTIFPEPPAVIWLAPHASTNLSIHVAVGSELSCQWLHNGQPIAGATATSLAITDFNAAKAGVYSFVVKNPYGSATATTVLRLDNSPVILVDGASLSSATITRTNTAEITLQSGFGSDAAIYYTLDGSAPDFTATLYSGALSLPNSATLRAMAYNFAHTKWAEAAPIHVEIWPAFPLTVTTAGAGSVSLSPAPYIATNCYPSNSIVKLTATASNLWGFVSWSGDITADSSAATVLMDRPREVQAVFGQFPLLATTAGGGTVSVSPAPHSSSNVYAGRTLVTLTATPHKGWSFIRWTGDSTDTAAVTRILMDQPRAAQAVFGAPLNLFTNGSGQVLVDPPTGPYLFGSTLQLTPVPAEGYEFFGWANAASGKANPLNFPVVTVPDITALFAVPKSNPPQAEVNVGP
ncbi:MAG TPA: chitobiase/beta-hexosaminidase C-terminal domain-containing protein [Verrucomicrobiota bacterium]|nr:chitobiase/beta-hexosaminidase C-terminal domain-containing protein [Verrucomicrobiota bacterium]HQL78479.1 chitobiase/beta-hexosaminidase C-terminal domain-containing protein [Verrucomicrobiota bacterium]